MTEASGGGGDLHAHEPVIWDRLRQQRKEQAQAQAQAKADEITFDCSCRWDQLKQMDEDQFRLKLDSSDAYAVFFIRALIGDCGDQKALSKCVMIGTDQPGAKVPEALASLLNETSDDTFVGADLVARISLAVARRIRMVSGCDFTPRLDCYKAEGFSEGINARFISADFVVAKIDRQVPIDVSNGHATNCCPSHYYHFGWVDGTPQNDTWKKHGWREESDRTFTNDPTKPQRTNEIETFLGFPAFLRHEEANVIFALTPDSSGDAVVKPSGCPSLEMLYNLGIKPFAKSKSEEYSKRAEHIGDSAKGCIVLSIGVTDQRAAYFDPDRFKSVYGLFLTIDLECGKNCQEGDRQCSQGGFLQRIIDDLKGARYQFKYKTLQVLTGNILNQMEEQTTRLRKSDQMLRQLVTPLQSLSDALGKTQVDVQEIRAILYEPMEAIFALQLHIAKFFEQNGIIDNPDGTRTRISHQPSFYKSEDRLADARWVLAHVLATIRGEKVVHTSSDEALKSELSELCRCSKDKTSSFHQLAVTTLAFIDYVDTDGILAKTTVALESVKRRLFSPFKPDEALKAIEGDVIAALLPTDATINGLDAFSASDVAIPANINPFSTQGHLLRFISGVVSATYSESEGGCKKFMITCCAKGTTINRMDCAPWITPKIIPQLFKVLSRGIQMFWNGSRPLEENWGDHADPFVQLLKKLPPQYQQLGELNVSDRLTEIRIDKVSLINCIHEDDGISIKIDQLLIRYCREFYVGKV